MRICRLKCLLKKLLGLLKRNVSALTHIKTILIRVKLMQSNRIGTGFNKPRFYNPLLKNKLSFWGLIMLENKEAFPFGALRKWNVSRVLLCSFQETENIGVVRRVRKASKVQEMVSKVRAPILPCFELSTCSKLYASTRFLKILESIPFQISFSRSKATSIKGFS